MSDKNEDGDTSNESVQSDNRKNELEILAQLIQEEQEIDEEVIDVLGGSDPTHCTYSEGYLKRQAVYACLTCVPESRTDPTKRAGICLACTYECHDDHDLIEIYTRRFFRCDCGTSRILAVRCKLDANKLEDNDRNVYGQNFSGIYCTCKRPCPDPDGETDDEMIQCVVCEDWFHSRHLNVDIPDLNAFDEMICDACTLNNEFLNNYYEFAIKPEQTTSEHTESTDLAAISSANEQNVIETVLKATENTPPKAIETTVVKANENNESTTNQTSESISNKRISNESDVENIPECKKSKSDTESTSKIDICVKPKKVLNKFKGASFWPIEWRSKLCGCAACLLEYKVAGVEYLLDEEDTVEAYKNKGRAKAAENPNLMQEEQMRELAGMDHVSKIETIRAYNQMKQNITNYVTKLLK